MAIVTTSIGTHAGAIAYNSVTTTEMIDAIKTQLASAGGWTFLTSSGDYHWFSAPQKDGPTDTYLKGLRIHLTPTTITMAVYEKMDTIPNQTELKLESSYNKSLSLDLDNGGTLYVLSSQQHVLFKSTEDVAGINYGFAGTFEWSRDIGVPVGPQSPYQWATCGDGQIDGQYRGWTSWIDNAGDIKLGTTVYTRHITDFVSWGQYNYSSSRTLAGGSYAMDADFATGTRIVSPIRTIGLDTAGRQKSKVFGRQYGLLAISGNVGDEFETVNVKLDASGFPDSAGTATECMIIRSQFNMVFVTPLSIPAA